MPRSGLAKLRRELEELKEQLRAVTDKPCVDVGLWRGGERTNPEPERRPGHKCGEACFAIAIRREVVAEDAGADSGQERGDVQSGPERAAAGQDVEPQPSPPRSSGEARALGPPPERARDATLGMERRFVVPLPLPPGWEKSFEPTCRNCGCGGRYHSAIHGNLRCAFCGFEALSHFDRPPPDSAIILPGQARRLWPCNPGHYVALHVGPRMLWDLCERCGDCRGFRALVSGAEPLPVEPRPPARSDPPPPPREKPDDVYSSACPIYLGEKGP